MLRNLKRTARKSKTLLIAFTIYKNWKMRRSFRGGNIESLHGSTHTGRSVEASLAYIDQQFADYLEYGGLLIADLKGKRILELGFGDNLGVALKFLVAGAKQVVCIDKFYSRRVSEHERAIYTAIRANLTGADRRSFDDAIELTEGITLNPTRLTTINGLSLETAVGQLSNFHASTA